MILYTYSQEPERAEDRWKDTGSRDVFFAELDEVRQAVFNLRAEILAAGDILWQPIYIERVELLAPTTENVLIMLNDGIGPIIHRHEIMETVR